MCIFVCTKCRFKSYQIVTKHDTVARRWMGSRLQHHSNCYVQEGLEVQLLCSSMKLLNETFQTCSLPNLNVNEVCVPLNFTFTDIPSPV